VKFTYIATFHEVNRTVVLSEHIRIMKSDFILGMSSIWICFHIDKSDI